MEAALLIAFGMKGWEYLDRKEVNEVEDVGDSVTAAAVTSRCKLVPLR